MKEHLQHLRDVMAQSGINTSTVFAPGLLRTQVEERLSALPYRVSTDAVDLFEFADGSDPSVDILPGVYLESLDYAISHCLMEYEMGQQDDEPFGFALRFLADGSDGGYGFGRLDSPSEGRIVDYCIHAPRRIAFMNLERLISTAIECFRQGIYPKDGLENSSFRRFYAIAAELNPGFGWNTEEE